MVLRKSIVLFFAIILCCCHNSKIDYTQNLDGEYYFSEDSNLSYYIPTNFKGSYVTNDNEFDSLVSTINHPKLKQSIDDFYKNSHVHPEAFNAQYFYEEDSINYTFLILNEIEYFRLNDKSIELFKGYRNSSFYDAMKDSLTVIDLSDDKFVNNSDYQIMTSRGHTKITNDSLFWEYYIVSKFLRTFTIMTNSDKEFDFEPYIKAVDFGDKRNSM